MGQCCKRISRCKDRKNKKSPCASNDSSRYDDDSRSIYSISDPHSVVSDSIEFRPQISYERDVASPGSCVPCQDKLQVRGTSTPPSRCVLCQNEIQARDTSTMLSGSVSGHITIQARDTGSPASSIESGQNEVHVNSIPMYTPSSSTDTAIQYRPQINYSMVWDHFTGGEEDLAMMTLNRCTGCSKRLNYMDDGRYPDSTTDIIAPAAVHLQPVAEEKGAYIGEEDVITTPHLPSRDLDVFQSQLRYRINGKEVTIPATRRSANNYTVLPEDGSTIRYTVIPITAGGSPPQRSRVSPTTTAREGGAIRPALKPVTPGVTLRSQATRTRPNKRVTYTGLYREPSISLEQLNIRRIVKNILKHHY